MIAKVTIAVLGVFFLTFGLKAQDADTTKIWTTGLQGSLTFSQVSLSNWAGGGQNSVALNSFVSVFANKVKDRITWENSLNLAYGLTKIGTEPLRKSDDKIELTSKYGYLLSPNSSKFSLTSSFTMRSQFAYGFNPEDDSQIISKFMAPGYFLLSTGIDYKPTPALSIFLSPATCKLTVVNDETLAAQGAFGVDAGKKSRFELGSFLKIAFMKEVVKNVTIDSKVDFFSNYSENPQDVDVNWETAIVMKINSFLSANLLTHLIYDKDVQFDVYENNILVGTEDRVQFKQVFGLGLTFKI